MDAAPHFAKRLLSKMPDKSVMTTARDKVVSQNLSRANRVQRETWLLEPASMLPLLPA